MTLGDVKREIFNLGFESEEDYDENKSIIIDAINRAMREITNVFPIIGEYQISQNPLRNILPTPYKNMDIKHYDGTNPIVYTAQGAKSLYFECSGTGTLTIVDDDGERLIELSSERRMREYREFINGDVTLKFEGHFSYDIKNIAVYNEVYSGDIMDIPPYRQYVRYDFKELTKIKGDRAVTPPIKDTYVFIDFLDKIQEGDFSEGNAYLSINDFQIERRCVLVLNGFEKVQYRVFYKKNFLPFTLDTTDETEIELDFDKEHLLPLLSAYFVWIDDDPTKAAQWKNEYEDYRNNLLLEKDEIVPQEEILNVMGW